MKNVKFVRTDNNINSSSKAKNFFGVLIMDEEGKPCSGEYTFDIDGREVKARFHNGFIDGNVYTDNEEVIRKVPAIEYGYGGKEYWSKGFPEGLSAVSKNECYYEENWNNTHIMEIRIEMKEE